MPHLYALTLQKASCIHLAVSGNFSAPKAQEIVAIRGNSLELLRLSPQGRLITVYSQHAFGLVRSLSTARLVGSQRDYLIIGSDSGRIVILEFDAKEGVFRKLHQETYGKSGCRRVVAGEYLAVDPSGRACMIAAVEKQKFVYILNRDLEQKLTISSPLEAHKANTIVSSLVGLDVGFDNPLFASLEVNYSASQSPPVKTYTIYEMDLGINHVVRKYAEPVPDSAHLLVTVEGGTDGPGGCLVCCDDFLVYKKLGRESITCVYPKRIDCAMDRRVMVIAAVKHKLKEFSLILLQSEFGDLFRVDLLRTPSGIVEEVRVTYFDTIPRSSSLCVLKAGFLFAPGEAGGQSLYQFKPSELLSRVPPDSISVFASSKSPSKIATFRPLSLRCLELVDRPTSLAPLTDLRAMDPLTQSSSGGACQIFALAGKSLTVLRHGVAVTELALSELPGKPSGVWTLSSDLGGMDKYIVLSFVDATLVLSVGGETVQEVSDSGLLGGVQTLALQRMHDQSFMQVHARGVRHVHESTGRIAEWKAPGGRQILHASTNDRQLVIALSGGELVYLELASETGAVTEIARREMGSEINSVAISNAKALLMAVASADRSVRVLSLEPDKVLKQVSAQSYQVAAESVVLSEHDPASLTLSIGLSSGVLVRCSVDRIVGSLSDPRSKLVGTRPVRLQRTGPDSLLALSSRPWLIAPSTESSAVPLAYFEQVHDVQIPVVLEYAAAFKSDMCAHGLVVVSQNTLRILSIDDSGSTGSFAAQSVPLSYTGRKLFVVPPPSLQAKGTSLFTGQKSALAIVESDPNAFSDTAKENLVAELKQVRVDAQEEEDVDWTVVGANGGSGQWASCLRLVDPVSLETLYRIESDVDECVICACVVYFHQLKDNRPCLVVATSVGLRQQPTRSAVKSVLKTYLYDDTFTPQLVHVTPIADGHEDGVPLAMSQFEGRLLLSMSANAGGISALRLYELGKKRLLKKSEYRNATCGGFMQITSVNDRIFAADVHQSIHVLKLNKVDGQMYTVCDDIDQRYMSSMLCLDYDTVVGADKFDSLFVGRIPDQVRTDQTNTGGLRLGPDTNYILGKTHKLEPVNQFHLGETVMCMQKVVMSAGATEVVMYGTLNGSIGVLYPFATKKEYELFLALENHMRNDMGSSIVGRDHAAFRGYYLPCKGVVDGDLVSSFGKLKNKAEIAKLVGRPVSEIEKLIEEIKNKIT